MKRKALNLLKNSVLKKILMSITGLSLVLFLFIHLIGNFLIFNKESFNKYAYHLHSLGILLYLAEIGLISFFLLHIINGIIITLENREAGGKYYKKTYLKKSYSSISSRTMIYTGIIILIFVIIHIKNFKYGPNINDGYVYILKSGEKVRDIHRVLVEFFKNPYYVSGYIGALIVLGFHLKHAIWSGLQSLGIGGSDTFNKILYFMCSLLAIFISGGFIIIPTYIYFFYK